MVYLTCKVMLTKYTMKGEMNMYIAIPVGHSLLKSGVYTSADGIVNEYKYNKELVNYVKKWLEKAGHKVDVIIVPERTYTSASSEKGYKLNIINKRGYDLVVELHLNASNGAGYGAEVYYYSTSARGKAMAQQVQKSLATVFRNRGVKTNNDLYILRDSYPPAILIETFFCDNKGDVALAQSKGYDAIGKLIAEGIHGKPISNPTPPPKPSGTTFYRVIICSNTIRESSVKVLNSAIAKGFKDAFLTTFNNPKDGKLYYRVVIGSYSVRDNAVNMKNKAIACGFKDAFLDAFVK